jgi:predicted ATP-dependent endonuclease of OLD family
MAQWVNPDRAEMFFCRRVVFVEGESEKVLLPFLANELGQLDTDVSVIDCGSKHNLPLYVRVAKGFEIPYLVVYDEDPLPDPIPDTWNQDKIRSKRDTFALNAKLEDLVEEHWGSLYMLRPGTGERRVEESRRENGQALGGTEALRECGPTGYSGMSKEPRRVRFQEVR